MSEENTEQHSHLKIISIVFGILLVLTMITVLVSYVNFGNPLINILIAMLIATLKANLVAAYFMHLRWETKLVKAFAAISMPILLLLIGLDLWDVGTRMFNQLYVF